MYQIVGLINKFMYGPGQTAADTVATWHNRREYVDESSDEETHEQNGSRSVHRSRNDIESEYIPQDLRLVILLSGKRKSGKDHISTQLTNYVGYNRMRHLAVLRIEGPIKKEFAKNNRLDFSRLLNSGGYKENIRYAMIEWSEAYREEVGWDCFLKQAIKEQRALDKQIWIVNDSKRLCDLEYFEDESVFAHTKILKVRVEASEEARLSRGWKFVEGIDDREAECELDDYEDWDHVIDNDYNDERRLLGELLKPIYDEIDGVFARLSIGEQQ